MFDYIIIGGGSAGCVLANRLSENPEIKVCLLEAGSSDWHPAVKVPAYLFVLMFGKKFNWGYHTQKEKSLQQRELFWPRGKMLGGCSSSNAMIYTRGHSSDYDHWESLGNKGWGYNDILPYFKKSQHQERGSNFYHGVNGPLNVADVSEYSEISQVFLNAGQEVGYDFNPDFNGKQQEGVGPYQVTQKKGRRCNTAYAYLKPIKKRKNLTIITHAHVTKINLESNKVTGLQYERKGKTISLKANKEVIVSAGAINSPQVLMLSGIGPKSELDKHNIPVQIDLPGVGENLQDHLDIIMSTRCKKPATRGISWDQVYTTFTDLFNFYGRNTGRLASNGNEVGGFVKSTDQESIPDLQFHFASVQLKNHGRDISALFGHAYSLHVCNLRPKSRGKITLNSTHPQDAVNIQANYLDHPEDMEKMLLGFKANKTLLSSQAFEGYRGKPFDGFDKLTTDDSIEQYIRRHAESVYHPVGTCKMGDDDMAVVDASLKVHGIKGLRVVDASIMPTIVGANTNAPTIAIAEKAADMIIAESTLYFEDAKNKTAVGK